jgi:ribosomal-protein-alanine N-acetyltransferase
MMSVFLETERLVINTADLADFDDLLRLQSDPDVMHYIGSGVRTKEEVMAGLEKALAHQEKYGFTLSSVYEKSSDQFVGRAGLIYLAYDDTQPDIEVGYALIKSAWNKGYATELTQALIAWGFQHINVEKLFGVIQPGNEGSRGVLQKSKMSYVGRTMYCKVEVALYSIAKPAIDFSQLKLVAASLADHPAIQNMGRFYVYDMSEYMGNAAGWEMPADGLYECIDFKKYWEQENAFPFFLYYGDELAGFVIIDKKGSDETIDFNMAQFYIVRKFIGKDVGRYVAQLCFDKFKGNWEVMVMPGNEGAYRFWRSTVKAFCGEDYVEYTRDIKHFNNSRKNIFNFNSANAEETNS